MAAAAGSGRDFIDNRGIALETFMAGDGPVVLFLHAGLWLGNEEAFLRELAIHARVIAPNHPGFGASDPPGRLAAPDDLAYFYLDLIDRLKLQDVILAGAGLGGWIAAEIATKNCSALSGLVLIDAFGIRPGGRNDRDIADIFGIADSELVKLAYARPPDGAGNLRTINDDEELRRRLRARDSLAHYGWQPYMHNPRLQQRLHRIGIPTLVLWGDRDGIVLPDYGRAYANSIPGAQFELVPHAGHLAHVEQPQAVARCIAAFSNELAAAGTPATAGAAS